MVPLPIEVVENIKDFMNGTNIYWRKQYNKVINDINNLKFFVFTEWSNQFCNLCRYNDCEFTIEIDYDEALKTYYQDMNKTFNFGCDCIIKECKILHVSDYYYDALNYYYPDDLCSDDEEIVFCRICNKNRSEYIYGHHDYICMPCYYESYDPYYNYNNNYYHE